MAKPEPARREMAYLVRLWTDDEGVWRASAEDLNAGTRVYVLGPHEVGDLLALRCDQVG